MKRLFLSILILSSLSAQANLHLVKDTKFNVPIIVFTGDCSKLNAYKVKEVFESATRKDESEETTKEEYMKSLRDSFAMKNTLPRIAREAGGNCALYTYGYLGRFPTMHGGIEDIVNVTIPDMHGSGAIVAYKQATLWNPDIRATNLVSYNSSPIMYAFNASPRNVNLIISTAKGTLGKDNGLRIDEASDAIAEAKLKTIKTHPSAVEYATVAARFVKLGVKGLSTTGKITVVVLGATLKTLGTVGYYTLVATAAVAGFR